jgi:hypothetical protein
LVACWQWPVQRAARHARPAAATCAPRLAFERWH